MARWPVTKTGLSTVGKSSAATGSGQNEHPVSDAWTPRDLGTALVGWWDVHEPLTVSQEGDFITQLNDLSGNGNHLSQADLSKKPKWVEHAISNSFEGALFDGQDDRLKNSTLVLPQPFSVAQILRTESSEADYAASFGGDYASDALIYISNADFGGRLCLSAGNTVDTGLTVALSSVNILTAQFNNASSEASLNGVTAATPNTGTFGISAGPSI